MSSGTADATGETVDAEEVSYFEWLQDINRRS